MFILLLLTIFFATLFVEIKKLFTEFTTHPYAGVKWKCTVKTSNLTVRFWSH